MLTIKARQYCDRCDSDSETDVESCRSPTADGPQSKHRGKLIEPNYFCYLDSTGALVPLRRLGKDSVITWISGTIQGRIINVTRKLCRQCGTINSAPRLQNFSGLGCLPGIALSIAIFALLTRHGVHHFISFDVALVAMFVPEVLLSRWLWHRYRDRNSKLAFTQCCNCEAADAVTIFEVLDQPLVCPNCQQSTMRFSLDYTMRVRQFSLRFVFIVTTLIAILLGAVNWNSLPDKVEHGTPEQANRVLRGYISVPEKATDIEVEYSPYVISMKFNLPESEAVAWCEQNGWNINPDTRKANLWFEFTTPPNEAGNCGGGNWVEGYIRAILFIDRSW